MSTPYRFGKDRISVALEATLRDPKKFDELYDQLVKALAELKATGQTTFTSTFKKSLPTKDRDHLNKDVFGKGQTDARAVAGGQERRLVYYDGLRQAMELAKRLGKSGPPAPIEIFWGCGYEDNVCWISWDKRGTPRVTAIFLSDVPATPGGAETVAVSRFPSTPAAHGLYVVRASGGGSTELSRAVV